MKPLKDRLSECMRRHPSLSPADIARACHVKPPSVADWLNGSTKTLKAETARLAAQLFGCDQNWLATGVGSPNWRDEPSEGATPGASLEEMLDLLGVSFTKLPDARRGELSEAFGQWIKYQGAPHWKALVAAILHSTDEVPQTDASTPHDRMLGGESGFAGLEPETAHNKKRRGTGT